MDENTAPIENYVVAGIDVGGTFTDLILVDSRAGSVRIAKTPTTVENQASGVIAALEDAGIPAAEIDLIVHGTTTTTNAVLERRLAKTGMITTAGFRDVIELGRRTRPRPYGMTGTFTPLIPRNLRLEVDERLDAQGRVLTPLDEDAMREAVQTLLDAGCETLVIHFLHAYANPAHELRAAEIAAEIWPNGHITTGHSLLSEAREFERGVTASVNAAVQPILKRYVERLRAELGGRGYARDFLMMNGNGGMISSALVSREAAKTVMSGPASGVMAAAHTGKRAGQLDLITYDMGGTSTDVALIRGAKPAVSNETEIEYAMPIHVPLVDVHTVGAGGGSIARIDEGGLIRVGPESAGAMPGPICYGRGGSEPTITDANLMLGRLSPQKLLSVDNPVSKDAVEAVFAESIGRHIGMDGTEAAGAVLKIANLKMAGAVRMVSLARGLDPRDFALFAFGGAGPLHATALARELGIPKVLVPARPGITNALGCVVADLRHDFVRTLNRPLRALDPAAIKAVLDEQKTEGISLIESEAVKPKTVRAVHSADMQFIGQTHIINVPLPSADVTIDELQALFEEAYFARFRVSLPEIRANLVNLNTSVIGEREAIDLTLLIDAAGRAATLDDALNERRQVWFGGAWYDTPVYAREKLPLDAVVEGPAILEQRDATTVLEPGDRATSDTDGNLIVEVSPSPLRGGSRHEVKRGGGGDQSAQTQKTPTPTLRVDPPLKGEGDLDAITLSVIEAGLQQVCDEMDLAFSRAAFSPVIAEANDRSDGIYSAEDGSLIAQGLGGLPVFVGVMQYSTRTLIEMIADGRCLKPEPGDIYIVNDPYLGGTHLMDVRFAMPVWRDGKIWCWLSNTGHWPDIGGSVPGGFSASATAVEQEGLRLPPVKLFKRGELDPEIYAIITSNIRVADQRIGDIKAQAAALHVGAERLAALLDRYGDETVTNAVAELRERAAARMRASIAEIEDGAYEGEAFVDSDGVVNEPLRIALTIEKKGEALTFDFAGSSPPCAGPMNSVLATTLSSVYLAMRHIFPDVPLSAGAFEPLIVKDPEGTFLHAKYPRPVSGCAAEVSQRIAEAVFSAMVKAVPDKVTAAPAGSSGNFGLGGHDPERGRDFVLYQISGGGYGGNADHDGLSNGCSTIGISKSPPVEIMEQNYPVLYRRYALREGSGGAGKQRGGFGLSYEVELLRGNARASFVMDHGRFGPQGALGGLDGGPNSVKVWRGGKAHIPEHLSKEQDITMQAGDRVEVGTPGGGGYGDPLTRDANLVARDVALGYYSAEEAERLFGVVLDKAGSVDEAATAKRRA